jgi:hypothetical protein
MTQAALQQFRMVYQKLSDYLLDQNVSCHTAQDGGELQLPSPGDG